VPAYKIEFKNMKYLNKINSLLGLLPGQTKKKDVRKIHEKLLDEFIVKPTSNSEEGTASGYGYFLGV
jgi:hypothetical protein